ncbi:MAG: glycosyltransferase family 39 protein, partial [Vicinamibacterales bacterium]
WASAVRGMSRGLVLYRDVWDHKPPGIFLSYLAAFNLFGWAPSSIAWMDLLASATTTILLFDIVRRVSDAALGALAAALYAVLTIPGWLYGNGGFLERSVAETFVVVAVAASAWCTVRLQRRASGIDAFGIGLGVGVAVVFKPNAAVYLPALVAWAVMYGPAGGRKRIVMAVTTILGSLVAPALTILWLWRGQALDEAWTALVVFNRFYLAQGFTLRQALVVFAHVVFLRMKTDPLWAAGGIGALVVLWDLARTRRLDPMAALAVVWGGAAAVAIFANGARLFNTYFIQALAPLAVLAAWLLAGLAGRDAPVARAAAAVAIVVMLVFMGLRQFVGRFVVVTRADLDALAGRGDRARYLDRFGQYGNGHGYSARANDELFSYLRAHTSREDAIYQFGISGAGVYFAADRLPAQRFLRVTAFLPATLAEPGFQRAAVLDEIARRRPAYIIFEQLHSTADVAVAVTVDRLPQDPDVARLLEAYQLDTQIEDFTLYKRVNKPGIFLRNP